MLTGLTVISRAHDRKHGHEALSGADRRGLQVYAVHSHTRRHETNTRLQRKTRGQELRENNQLFLSFDEEC